MGRLEIWFLGVFIVDKIEKYLQTQDSVHNTVDWKLKSGCYFVDEVECTSKSSGFKIGWSTEDIL